MRKFSIVINAQANVYVAVLRCTDADGVTIDSKTLTGIISVEAAIVAAQEFIAKNQD